MFAQLVPSLTHNITGCSLQLFSGVSGKFGRGPVFLFVCLFGCFVGSIMQCFKKQPC